MAKYTDTQESIEVIKSEDLSEINKISKNTIYQIVRGGRLPEGITPKTEDHCRWLYREAVDQYRD